MTLMSMLLTKIVSECPEVGFLPRFLPQPKLVVVDVCLELSLNNNFASPDETVVDCGRSAELRELILDVGGATESLRGLLGLEPRESYDGPGLTEWA